MVAKEIINDSLPKWLKQGFVLALLAVLCGAVGSWVGSVDNSISMAVTANAVQEEKIERSNTDISEMKASLRRIEDKIDNLK